jgi:threonine dehydratase
MIEDIKKAVERLSAFRGRIIKTPLVYSPALSEETGVEVYLKLECMQAGGSFKIRGALNYAAARKEEGGIGGFVTCSSGNHGAAKFLSAVGASPPPG